MAKLVSTTNTPTAARRIWRAFEARVGGHNNPQVVFEHGQWWVTCPPCGAMWATVDIRNDLDELDVDFEELETGDESCR